MNIDQIGPSSAGMLPKLIEMLGDEHRSVRGSVAKALYEIGGVSILDQVIQVSEKNPNPEARAARSKV